ncbi:MAG: GSCFA domain-containing protein [Lentisphaerae bacterium]|nr:GSCFA domain-containing protein [Lentisphaerota bacterium]
MPQLSTTVAVPPAPFRLTPATRILCLGSCFAAVVGKNWQENLLPGLHNPCGILFNPASILNILRLLEDPQAEQQLQQSLFQRDGLWHSFLFHSCFSAPEYATARDGMLAAWDQTRRFVPTADILFLTWGSARVWKHQSQPGQPVSNCHCLPAQEFHNRLLSAEEIQLAYTAFLEKFLDRYPDLQVVLSVSPVRHLGDGAAQNSVNKANLLLAAQRLVQSFPNRITYFPAYEILLDELRDYRFYGPDLCHPNQLAESIIWERLTQAWGGPELAEYLQLSTQLLAWQNHQPRLPDGLPARRWRQKAELQIQALNTQLAALRQPRGADA